MATPTLTARAVGLTTRDLSSSARAATSDASPPLALAPVGQDGDTPGAPIGLLLMAGLTAVAAMGALWGVQHLGQRPQ